MGNILTNIIYFCENCIKIEDDYTRYYYDDVNNEYYYDTYDQENTKTFFIKRRLSVIPETSETTSSNDSISPYSRESLNSQNSQNSQNNHNSPISPLILCSPEIFKKKEFVMEFQRK